MKNFVIDFFLYLIQLEWELYCIEFMKYCENVI